MVKLKVVLFPTELLFISKKSFAPFFRFGVNLILLVSSRDTGENIYEYVTFKEPNQVDTTHCIKSNDGHQSPFKQRPTIIYLC